LSGGFELDARVFASVYGRGEMLGYAMVALTMLGSGWAALGLGPLLASTRTRSFAAWLTGVIVAQSVVVALLKLAVGRTRPYVALRVSPLFDAPTDHSFPSGHASGSFAVAAFVFASVLTMDPHPRRRSFLALACAAIGLATAIAVSRVWLGVHWPSDVAGGAAIGSAIGAAGALARQGRSRRRPQVPEG
jgi:undecaprenyl-diphosphatase